MTIFNYVLIDSTGTLVPQTEYQDIYGVRPEIGFKSETLSIGGPLIFKDTLLKLSAWTHFTRLSPGLRSFDNWAPIKQLNNLIDIKLTNRDDYHYYSSNRNARVYTATNELTRELYFVYSNIIHNWHIIAPIRPPKEQILLLTDDCNFTDLKNKDLTIKEWMSEQDLFVWISDYTCKRITFIEADFHKMLPRDGEFLEKRK